MYLYIYIHTYRIRSLRVMCEKRKQPSSPYAGVTSSKRIGIVFPTEILIEAPASGRSLGRMKMEMGVIVRAAHF